MSEYDTKRNGIPVRIVETGEIFNSVQACADRLGVSTKWLARVVRGDSHVYSCHGYHVVPIDDNADGFEPKRASLFPLCSKQTNSLLYA